MKHVELYEILGVEPDATPDEIRKAYRERAKETHSDQGGEDEDFIEIAKAYEILSNPDLRAQYDRTGETDPRATQVRRSIAIGLFIAAMERDPDNIMTMIREVVELTIQDREVEIRAIRRAIEKQEEAIGRITSAPEDDFLGNYLRGKIVEGEAALSAKEDDIENHKKAVELLAEYGFERRGGVGFWIRDNRMTSAGNLFGSTHTT